MTPRFGPSPSLSQTYTPRHGVYCVLERGGQVLLTLQTKPSREYQLPGGGIDPGEGPIQALHREVLEETGYAIATPRRLGVFRRFTYMPEYTLWAEKICTVYVARPTLRRGPPLEPDHHAVWVSPSDAVQILGNDGDRYYAARHLNLAAPNAVVGNQAEP